MSLKHEDDKVLAFEKGDLLFVFNFNSHKSFEHYRIGTKWPTEHDLVLDTDGVLQIDLCTKALFGGHSRVSEGYKQPFPVLREEWNGRPNYIQIYLPNRCALVFKARP